MDEVIVYTDGACKGNPGPGGWAARLIHGKSGAVRDICGGEALTTNNRMEMMGVIQALRAFKRPVKVKVHCDSAYVVNAFKQGWLANWQANGWKTSAKKPVENQDLWRQLLDASKDHKVEWMKVKGHAGVEHNEACDRLAVEQSQLAAG